MKALVVTVSDRASAGVYDDQSGPIVEQGLLSMGFATERVVVGDGGPLRAELTARLAQGYDAIITTGGTGLAARDLTPEVTRPLLDYELPHLAAHLALTGVAKGVPTAVLSRGVAGVAGRTLVVNLPGSRGGASDGVEVLRSVLVHAVQQLHGGDHEPAAGDGDGVRDRG